jgi:response regulator RpfG family c-di-GMP phosphodiesterase
MPQLGIKVIAQQEQIGLQATNGRLIARVRSIGVLISLLVVSLSACALVMINLKYESSLARTNASLEELVEKRSQSLVNTREAVIFGLAKLAESRDEETGEHLERIRRYVELLARELSKDHPELDEETIRTIGLASSLHDIGKVGIPDHILLKRGTLTPEERSKIQAHARIGGDCLRAIIERLGADNFLSTASDIAHYHHERWDGGGYPHGTKGEDIPLSARIVALADVYDALTTTRIYKPAFTHDKARETIASAAGTHFDPRVVTAFLNIERKFRECYSPYGPPIVKSTPIDEESDALVMSDA